MRAFLKRHYLIQAFNPGWTGLLTNPFYHARKGLYQAIEHCSGGVGGRVLDAGCGQKPYEQLFRCDEYVGLEYDSEQNRKNKKADVFYTGGAFPFQDGEFDSVVCNQVLEHVFGPDEFIGEIARVLKPGGALLLTVPFSWDEHEQPHDYARYTSFGVRDLIERNGFRVDSLEKTALGPRALAQLAAGFVYKITCTRFFTLNLVLTMLLIAPINSIGAILARLLPSGQDIYLDNVVFARKKA